MAGEPICLICCLEFDKRTSRRQLTWAHDSCLRKASITDRAFVARQSYLIDKDIATEMKTEESLLLNVGTDDGRFLKAMENFARVAVQDSRDRIVMMKKLGEIAIHAERTSENVKQLVLEVAEWFINNKLVNPPPSGTCDGVGGGSDDENP